MPFKGIYGLRSANEVIKYTPAMLDELLKCADDPIYFCRNYIIINSKDDGKIKFPVRDYQEDIIRSFNDNKMVMTKWPRQCGKSTCTVAYLLWYAIFHSHKTIAVLANKLDLAKEQLENLKQSYMDLPEWMQPGIVSWAKKAITLANGSRIMCAATSTDGIRGLAINILYLDEFAFVPSHIADKFIASVFPTVASGKTTKVIITSTPNGMNHFFHMWDEAERGESSFVPKQIAWNTPPGRDEKWAREMIRTIGDEIKFNQEYKCEFIGSQSTLVDHTFLTKMIKETKKPLILEGLPEEFKIWQLPISKREMEIKNWEYAASLDSALGMHKDSTVLSIFLVKNNIKIYQVAKFASNKIEIQEFCKLAFKLLKAYHQPALIIEQNGPGIVATNLFFNTFEYENLINFDPSGKKLGLTVSAILKDYTAVFLKAYIQKKLLRIFDHETVKELLAFGRKGRSWEGLGGNHDDHVMTLMWLVYYVISPYFYGNVVDVDVVKDLPNDPTILLSEQNLSQEILAQINMKNPDFHKKELEDAFNYMGTINTEDDDDNKINSGREDGMEDSPSTPFIVKK